VPSTTAAATQQRPDPAASDNNHNNLLLLSRLQVLLELAFMCWVSREPALYKRHRTACIMVTRTGEQQQQQEGR
jgi:hypothetical protein